MSKSTKCFSENIKAESRGTCSKVDKIKFQVMAFNLASGHKRTLLLSEKMGYY